MDFEIIRGNIATVSADAIVLPANSKLEEGNGASKAIFEAAGRRKLTKACKEVGCCDVGNAVPTLAFDLQAKYIIHAVVPKWVDGEHNEYEMLCAAYLTALNLADQMKCKSIAFPLLSSGNNGFDLELAFEIARESFINFAPGNLERIILVVYGYQITTLIKQKGFNVIEVPANVQELVKQADRHQEAKAIKKDGKAFCDRYHISLNKQQERAVLSVDGAVLLLAVPGSGKTTVLIDRIGHMVANRHIDPKSIL